MLSLPPMLSDVHPDLKESGSEARAFPGGSSLLERTATQGRLVLGRPAGPVRLSAGLRFADCVRESFGGAERYEWHM